MRQTQDVPTCPNCGAPVLRTHRCSGPPAKLVTMPADWRAQVAEAIASGHEEHGRTDYQDALELDLPELPDRTPGMWSR